MILKTPWVYMSFPGPCPTPPGLLNLFTQDEILDLLAYLGFGTP